MGSDFTIKDKRKGLFKLPLWPRETAEAMDMSGVSLNKIMKVEAGIHWRL